MCSGKAPCSSPHVPAAICTVFFHGTFFCARDEWTKRALHAEPSVSGECSLGKWCKTQTTGHRWHFKSYGSRTRHLVIWAPEGGSMNMRGRELSLLPAGVFQLHHQGAAINGHNVLNFSYPMMWTLLTHRRMSPAGQSQRKGVWKGLRGWFRISALQDPLGSEFQITYHTLVATEWWKHTLSGWMVASRCLNTEQTSLL